MKKIEDIIKIKLIQLDNVKVKFTVKLLQYDLNAIIFKYKQKYAFQEHTTKLIKELTDTVTNSQPYKDKDKEVEEILTKTRDIIILLREYNKNTVINPQDLSQTIDSSLRYILFQYSKNKQDIDLYKQLEILDELKLIKHIITSNNIQETERIKNSYKLIEQIKENIINIIKE